jgi:hypothetical protein
MNCHDFPADGPPPAAPRAASCDTLPLARLRRREQAQRAATLSGRRGHHVTRCAARRTRPTSLAEAGNCWDNRLYWPQISWRLAGPR